MSLDTVLADLGQWWAIIKPHWPFFAYALFFAFVGEVSKRQVFTPVNEAAMEKQADRLWNKGGFFRVPSFFILLLTRSPLAFHPIVASIFLGLIPGIWLSAGVHYGIQSVMYCMGSAVLSLALYDMIHGLFKFWWRVVLRQTDPAPDIHLPGETNPPAAPDSSD